MQIRGYFIVHGDMSIFIRQNFAVYLVYFQIGGLYHLYMF